MTKSLDGKVVCEKHQWPTKDCIMCMSAVYETEQIAYLMRDRIAELEAACEKAEYELDWHSDELRTLEKEEQLFNKTFDAQQMIIEELRADNQRLRDALEIIAGKRQCVNNLMGNVEIAMAALLGGGENV